jgi:hypothetical protein
MITRCPTCGYELTGRAGARCPECGTIWTDDELRRQARNASRSHSRADLAGHGGAVVFCLFIALISTQLAIKYGAPHLLIGALVLGLIAAALLVSLRRMLRRWRATRDDR